MKSIQNSKQTLYWRNGDIDFIHPAIKSNNLMDGSVPAVSYSATYRYGAESFGNYTTPYNAISPNTGYIGLHSNEGTRWGNVVLYFPDGLIATKMSISNLNKGGKNYMSSMYELSFGGSNTYYSEISDINNDSNWDIFFSNKTISLGKTGTYTFDNSIPCKYYRIKARPGKSAYADGCTFANIRLYGTQISKDTATQATATFYNIVNGYKLGYRENKYWGLG